MPGRDTAGESVDDALVDAIYQELRRLARRRIAREPGPHTLQATDLVHEAWLRLEGRLGWEGPVHYYNAAALAMRRILVDRARRRRNERRGGDPDGAPIELAEVQEDEVDVLALDAALGTLARIDPRAHQVVQLRFLAGLSVEETARVSGLSPRTVKREWAAARLWLFDRIRAEARP